MCRMVNVACKMEADGVSMEVDIVSIDPVSCQNSRGHMSWWFKKKFYLTIIILTIVK